jgi:hypothetical protein
MSITATVIWKVLEGTHTTSWLIGILHHFPTILGWIAPRITHPAPGALVQTPMTVSGTHDKPKGNFWLVTNYKNDYWPKGKLHLRPDGRWEVEITTADAVTATILPVKASNLQDKLFDLWMETARANNWKPLNLPPSVTTLITVDSIVVNVRNNS